MHILPGFFRKPSCLIHHEADELPHMLRHSSLDTRGSTWIVKLRALAHAEFRQTGAFLDEIPVNRNTGSGCQFRPHDACRLPGSSRRSGKPAHVPTEGQCGAGVRSCSSPPVLDQSRRRVLRVTLPSNRCLEISSQLPPPNRRAGGGSQTRVTSIGGRRPARGAGSQK